MPFVLQKWDSDPFIKWHLKAADPARTAVHPKKLLTQKQPQTGEAKNESLVSLTLTYVNIYNIYDLSSYTHAIEKDKMKKNFSSNMIQHTWFNEFDSFVEMNDKPINLY